MQEKLSESPQFNDMVADRIYISHGFSASAQPFNVK